MLSHRRGSNLFENFLSLLGERVPLNGWSGYSGGLDVSSKGMDGEYSIFRKHDNYEIMFHVSTLLPFDSNDPQQIRRKRHICNDSIVIVFMDSPLIPFSPLAISTRYTMVYIVVTPDGMSLSFPSKSRSCHLSPLSPLSLSSLPSPALSSPSSPSQIISKHPPRSQQHLSPSNPNASIILSQLSELMPSLEEMLHEKDMPCPEPKQKLREDAMKKDYNGTPVSICATPKQDPRKLELGGISVEVAGKGSTIVSPVIALTDGSKGWVPSIHPAPKLPQGLRPKGKKKCDFTF